jgi:outer membrane protein assembly factor BamB
MYRQELAPAVESHARSCGPTTAARAVRRLACILAGLALLGLATPGVGAEESGSRRHRSRREKPKASKAESRKKEEAVRRKAARKKKAKEKTVEAGREAPVGTRRGRRDVAREAVRESAGVVLPDDLPLKYIWSLPFERNRPESIWIYKDVILVTARGNVLYCIRKADGVPLWAIELSEAPQYPPAVTERMVYVFVLNRLTAIDRAAGQILWRIEPNFPPASAPTVKEPNLYIAGWGRRMHSVMIDSKERVYITGATEEETLKAREYFFKYAWHKTTAGHVVAPPTIDKDMLYFGSEDGYLYAVTQDGEERYRSQTLGAIRAPVRVATGKVYVGGTDFNAYAFDRLTGQPVWIFPTGSDVQEAIYADAPAGVAIVTSNKKGIYGILDEPVPGRGSELWHIEDATHIAGVGPKFVYLALADRRLAAVEKKTGMVEWLSLLDGVRYVVTQQNEWMDNKDPMRLVCLTESYHLVCLKETTEELRRALEERR